MTTPTLKDCPFCGHKPKFNTIGSSGSTNGHSRKVSIECVNCGASTKQFGNVSDAQQAWNMRTEVNNVTN